MRLGKTSGSDGMLPAWSTMALARSLGFLVETFMPDFSNISSAEETRGWAHANRVVGYALLAQLRRKGLLTEEEVCQVLGQALQALENAQMRNPGDQSVLIARDVLDAMMERLCPPKLPK